MNRTLVIAPLLIAAPAGAQNIVPNPSFENLTDCPSYYGQFGFVSDWFPMNGGNPDLYNPCATNPEVSAPSNVFGYQQPASGIGYVGMWGWSGQTISGFGYREIIGARLIEPLIAGHQYWFSMKVSWTSGFPNPNGHTGFASNNMGVKCAMDSLWIDSYWIPWQGHANYHSVDIITDSVNWTLLSGSFVVDSAYQFIYIGNFYDDVSTSVQQMDASGQYFSYYYADDVCLSPFPGSCPEATGVEHVLWGTNAGVRYEPTNATLYLSGLEPAAPLRLDWFDVSGRSIGSFSLAQGAHTELSVKIDPLPTGFCMLRLTDGRVARTWKLLIPDQ